MRSAKQAAFQVSFCNSAGQDFFGHIGHSGLDINKIKINFIEVSNVFITESVVLIEDTVNKQTNIANRT